MIDKIKWKFEEIHYYLTKPFRNFIRKFVKSWYLKLYYDPYYEWVLTEHDYAGLYSLVHKKLREMLDDNHEYKINLTVEELGDLLDKVEYGMKI